MKTIHAATIALALFATPVLAQTTTSPTTTNPNGTAVTRIDSTSQIAPRTDDHTDYGWVGLFGLIGLAGLLGRKKAVPVVHSTAPVNNTTNRL